jgi:FdhD protein
MTERPRSALASDDPLLALGYSPPARTRQFVRLAQGVASPAEAPVAEEVPVAFVYNLRPHVVMMATPADLEDFAVGFTLAEEIVERAVDIGAVSVQRHSEGIELQLEIPTDAADRLALRARALAGRTGCGLCGVQAIGDVLRTQRTVSAAGAIEATALWRAEASLDAAQRVNEATRAVHAAAFATAEGELVVVREDVGRHNALDKVIGSLARSGTDASSGFLVVTSRASYELVQKSAVAGAPLLAAVSRPTGLAIRLAEASGITLVGLLRGESANVYTHAERIKQ